MYKISTVNPSFDGSSSCAALKIKAMEMYGDGRMDKYRRMGMELVTHQ
jgi:hypothetical protein